MKALRSTPAKIIQFPAAPVPYEAGMKEGERIAKLGYCFNEAYAYGVIEALTSRHPSAWLEGFREAFRIELEKQEMGA